MALSESQLWPAATILFVIYCLSLIVYRLFLHPLSRFPGPKLSACTLWYEFYYDVVLGGQWVWKIQDMHERYGPIVRINPHELHVRDADFYQELYAPTHGSKKRDKYRWWVNMAGAPGSIFATVDHDMHRRRRAPLDNFFSQRGVRELEPLIQSKVDKLSSRLMEAAKQSKVVEADCAFMAVTMDVISSYCFGADSAYLDCEDFGLQWKKTINGAWQKAAMLRAFPIMPSLMRSFPRSLAKKLDPNMGSFLEWQDRVKAAVQRILNHEEPEKKSEASRTIFHTLRDSDLPFQERSLRRLCDEGEIFTGAGSETTAKTLSTILFHLVNVPRTMKALKEELRQAAPNADILPSWTSLEQLPYLSAVIQEGLRLSYGITTRLPRISSEPLVYQGWMIPAGTPVSQTMTFILTDPSIFPEPHVFKPERWLGPDKVPEKYMVNFGRGSRSCIGVNLAHAELFLTCAVIYRRFSFKLHQTTSKDVEMVHDFFVAEPGAGYGGVRVEVFPEDS